jgi:ATP-dependent Clp protease ATP-binding subunit ClpC
MDWIESAKELLEKWKARQEEFTPRSLKTLELARGEADRLHHNYLGTEHLLLGLIKLEVGLGNNLLKNLGLNLENVRVEVIKLAGAGDSEKCIGNIPYTPRMRHVLDAARTEAKTLKHTCIGTEHLLLGLLREKQGPAAEIFKKFGIDIEQARTAILKELDPNFSSGDDTRKG